MAVEQAWCWDGDMHPFLFSIVGRAGSLVELVALLPCIGDTGGHGLPCMEERKFEELRMAIELCQALGCGEDCRTGCF